MKKFLSPRLGIFLGTVLILGLLTFQYSSLQKNLQSNVLSHASLPSLTNDIESFVEKQAAEGRETYLEDVFILIQHTPLCIEHLSLVQQLKASIEKAVENQKKLNAIIGRRDSQASKQVLQERDQIKKERESILYGLMEECPEKDALVTFLETKKPKCEAQEKVYLELQKLQEQLQKRERELQGTPGGSDQIEVLEKAISSLLRDIQQKMFEFESILCPDELDDTKDIEKDEDPIGEDFVF